MAEPLEGITINPRQCGGHPCIRGMRIRVSDVLDLFAAGLSAADTLAEMPDLEADDLRAAPQYAARKLNYPVLVSYSRPSPPHFFSAVVGLPLVLNQALQQTSGALADSRFMARSAPTAAKLGR